MPTRYPRIGVIRDPELSDALRCAASRLTGSSDAARLRELALIGARSLNVDTAEVARVRTGLDDLGATSEGGDLLTISRKLRARAHRTDETACESLEWARGPR